MQFWAKSWEMKIVIKIGCEAHSRKSNSKTFPKQVRTRIEGPKHLKMRHLKSAIRNQAMHI